MDNVTVRTSMVLTLLHPAITRYVTLQALGDGTYGSVVLGQRVDTGEKVLNKPFEAF